LDHTPVRMSGYFVCLIIYRWKGLVESFLMVYHASNLDRNWGKGTLPNIRVRVAICHLPIRASASLCVPHNIPLKRSCQELSNGISCVEFGPKLRQRAPLKDWGPFSCPPSNCLLVFMFLIIYHSKGLVESFSVVYYASNLDKS